MKRMIFGLMMAMMSLVFIGCPNPTEDTPTPDQDISLLAMVTVPAGSFQRDATATNISTITTAYRMSKYEVTRAQFLEVLGTDPSSTMHSSGTDDPVQRANWYHAIAFCNKLSLDEERTPVYSVSVGGSPVDFETLTYADIPTASNADWNSATANWSANGYRLPTEMEWMWAAMGADTNNPGQVNTTGYSKAFAGSTGSNAIGDYVWYNTNSNSMTHPTGTKLSNELSLHDMTGNVWEWCWDWYGAYPTGTVTSDSEAGRGAVTISNRIIRGGGWSYNGTSTPVADRGNISPSYQGNDLGFRVVRP